MTRDGWLQPAEPWDTKESWADRAKLCLIFLCMKGLLTDDEKARIQIRFEKQFRDNEPRHDEVTQVTSIGGRRKREAL
jgi:hypothetical protein